MDTSEIITVNDFIRLKKYDGNYEKLLSGYTDPYVYRNSEGILDDRDRPDLDYVKGMCEYLSSAGEFYMIQIKEGEAFEDIGDVTVKAENPPICIWYEKYRGRGIGSAVMKTVIRRLKELGYGSIEGTEIFKWNEASQKMHEKLGFVKVGEGEREYIYRLDIK